MRRWGVGSILAALVGCGQRPVDGRWVGLVECDGRGRDFRFELVDHDRLTWTGYGVWETVCVIPSEDGDFEDGCLIRFAIELTKDKGRGEQVVEVALHACEVDYQGDREPTECPGPFEDVRWDGASRIEGSFDGCEFVVLRET